METGMLRTVAPSPSPSRRAIDTVRILDLNLYKEIADSIEDPDQQFVSLSLIKQAMVETYSRIEYKRPPKTSRIHQLALDGHHISCPNSHRPLRISYLRALHVVPGLVALMVCPYSADYGYIFILTSKGAAISTHQYALTKLDITSRGILWVTEDKFIAWFGDPGKDTSLRQTGFVRA